MASNECFRTFAAAEEAPILHYYGLEIITMAKKIMISTLLLKGDKVDVEEFLQQTFPSKKQIILAPYHGGVTFSLDDMPFGALEEVCAFKPSNEATPMITVHNLDQYNTLRLAYLNAGADDKAVALEDLRGFVHHTVLENLAASIHKEFASYYHPVEEQQLLLLGNRKIYSSDKNKISRVEASKKKEDAAQKRSEARAALPSTSSKPSLKNSASTKPSAQASAKASQNDSSATEKPTKAQDNSNEKKRRSSKPVNYKEGSGTSTSSVEYPVEGTHTDEESEANVSDSGNKTPVFNQTQPEPFPSFMTSPAATLNASGPLTFKTRIPKHKRKPSKHSRRTKSISSDDLDSKPSSTRERKRLEKKSSKRKSSKKVAKRNRKYSSTSSSSSSSEEDSVPSEQVSCALSAICCFLILYPLYLLHNPISTYYIHTTPGCHELSIKL